ncbi:hypothetical protein N431DRAFT_470327 [Stipitochalara longipes BDJ]|nr:hypothetical protein N431DRAFT_470327 [Stipitochalara longipes BDJ]
MSGGRRGAAGLLVLLGSEASDDGVNYQELQRFGRTVTASLSTWREHAGKPSLSAGSRDGGVTSVVAIRERSAVLDRLPGREPSRGSTLKMPQLLNACIAHLGVPIALSRVADWGGGLWRRTCSKGLVRRRNTVQMVCIADPARRLGGFSEMALEGMIQQVEVWP